MATEIKNKQIDVDEEIRSINRSQMSENVSRTGTMLITMGVFEVLFGMMAVAVSSLTGAVFVVLMGVAIIVSGVLEFISAFAHNSLSRFAWGILGIAAGSLIVAQPSIGLNILGAIVGIFLIATGIARLFGSEKRLWARIGGAIGIILGIVVLAQASTLGAFLLGLIIGVYIMINGIITIASGSEMKSLARAR